jgi:hypothetical protein
MGKILNLKIKEYSKVKFYKMKTFKVFNRGKILKSNYYNELKTLDYKVFSGCGDEFKENRDWWVIVSGNQMIALI